MDANDPYARQMEACMAGKTKRVVIAAAAITLASATGTIGPVLGAAAVDYAAQKLAKREAKK